MVVLIVCSHYLRPCASPVLLAWSSKLPLARRVCCPAMLTLASNSHHLGLFVCPGLHHHHRLAPWPFTTPSWSQPSSFSAANKVCPAARYYSGLARKKMAKVSWRHQEAAGIAECRTEECKEECKVVRAAGTLECRAANKADRKNKWGRGLKSMLQSLWWLAKCPNFDHASTRVL